ncbi:hypothetical protein SPSYN_01952 [Sporotomaculum syntrophicum]|uniref:Uncharacterized protein n=1 Tax=Sporotomaculum syntrophicum TaxID=182264 RepID=A0A9D2WNM1_9FIRM|nr:hypothetical protein SPSYN_01952 [Sporotomaculum syntrophicum]
MDDPDFKSIPLEKPDTSIKVISVGLIGNNAIKT